MKRKNDRCYPVEGEAAEAIGAFAGDSGLPVWIERNSRLPPKKVRVVWGLDERYSYVRCGEQWLVEDKPELYAKMVADRLLDPAA